MLRRLNCVAIFLSVVVFGSVDALWGQTYNANTEMYSEGNSHNPFLPNSTFGTWSLGYRMKSEDATADFHSLDGAVSDTYTAGRGITANGWQPSITMNKTGGTVYPYSPSGPLAKDGILMYPGPKVNDSDASYAVLRWTAPKTGTITISTLFVGVGWYSTSDVRVQRNGTTFCGGMLTGMATEQNGSQLDMAVVTGDHVDVVVGCGPNSDYFQHDGTGLFHSITYTYYDANTEMHRSGASHDPFSPDNEFGTWRLGYRMKYEDEAPGGTSFHPMYTAVGDSNLAGRSLDTGWLPGILVNKTGGTVYPYSPYGGPLAKDGIVIYPGPKVNSSDASYAVLRWTAPKAGKTAISTHFSGVGCYSTSDIRVKLNADVLFSGSLSYAGDQAEVNLPEVTVNTGDFIDVLVGCGPNSDYYQHDGTSVFHRISYIRNGRDVLLERDNVQLQCPVYFIQDNAFDNTTLWDSAKFNTLNFWMQCAPSVTALLNEVPAGTIWARGCNVTMPETMLLTKYEMPYVDQFASFEYGNEVPGVMGELGEIEKIFRIWNTLYPNALAFTGFAYDAPTDSELATYMKATKPSVICFDWYPRYDSNFSTGSPSDRATWYNTMQKYRNRGLLGNDGTGNHPIPYGQTLSLIRRCGTQPPDNYYTLPLPSESFLRLQQFASWAFGYTFLTSYGYNDPDDIITPCAPILFSEMGDDYPITEMFDYLAGANLESRKLGPALIRLKSTGIYIKNGSGLSTPSSMTAWSSGVGCPRLTAIDRYSGVNKDILVGFFAPHNVSDPWKSGWLQQTATTWHFMIVNGAWGTPTAPGAPGDPALASTATIRLAFTGVPSTSTPHLRMISRTLGEDTDVPLTKVSSTSYRVDIALPGGTGELLKFYY